MDAREFPVLTDEDEALVDQFAAGLGDPAARALAYLSRRRADSDLDSSATVTAIHVGTALGTAAVRDELAALKRVELVERTTVETTTPGRPPDAWHAIDSRAASTRRVYERHAERLLEQAEAFAASTADRSVDDPGADRVDEPFTIGLNWRPNGLHAPVFAALEADVGTVDAVAAYEGSSAAIGAVAAGAVDVGVAGAATTLKERARGRPVVPIALLYQRTPAVLYTMRDIFGEPFEELAQLRGRRLGTPSGTETELLATLLLEQADIRDAVEVVSIEGEERIPLRADVIDVATGAHPDPWRLERAGESVDVIPVARQYPAYGPALVAHQDVLSASRTRLAAILAAVTAGWANATGDPVISALKRRSAESTDGLERTVSLAMDRFGTSEAVSAHGWGWHTVEEWHGLRDALVQGEVL